MSDTVKKRGEAIKSALKEKSAGMKDALGFFALGIVTDYFVFKPVRFLAPMMYVMIGFGLGMLYKSTVIDTIIRACN